MIGVGDFGYFVVLDSCELCLDVDGGYVVCYVL